LRQQAKIAAQDVAVGDTALDGQCGIKAYEDGLHGLEAMADKRQSGNEREVVLELLDDQ
jgi:hypothetical protein